MISCGNSFSGGRLPADSTTERESPFWVMVFRQFPRQS